MPNVEAREAPASPVTESGSFDRAVGDDALSRAMVRILERVTGTTKRSSLFNLRDEAYQWWLTVREGTQADRLTWDFFKSACQGKYVGASYVDARRKEFLSLIQGNKTVAEYEAEFLRLSHYARRIVANEYERCVRFEDSLWDELRILIAPQRERDFATLVEKAKITEDVKCSERQNREKDRGRFKKDLEPSSSSRRPKNKARFDGPVRAGVSIVKAQPCADCWRHHLGECWKKIGACFKCGSKEHQVKDCPQRLTQMQATGQGFAQPVRGSQQPPRGCGQVRGGNGVRRGCGMFGRGVGNNEARQPALVYATHRREDGDAPDVIIDTFLIHNVPFTTLIDIGSTHSYIACTVSGTLGIMRESTITKMIVLSPLGKSVRVDKLFTDVPLEVQGVIFLEDLMELPFGELDLILGMD
ncbi:uncharacterized protein LOC128033972 [Gossypium raimondii]|uniref:uncharacterized protein LOC128033972 n=1 Tax=Gossypium raimondii TaxID=29730 RepID=UPI00227B0C5B|nr:uncharacterized protein LOC128033972 [Gossypium raimondii]